MIAADTNVWIAFLNGIQNKNTDRLAQALERGMVVMPTVVLFELLSGELSQETEGYLIAVPATTSNLVFWLNAAKMRKQLLGRGLKSRIADCLIAQSCIDSDCEFLTEDKDFRHYLKFGLRIAK